MPPRLGLPGWAPQNSECLGVLPLRALLVVCPTPLPLIPFSFAFHFMMLVEPDPSPAFLFRKGLGREEGRAFYICLRGLPWQLN